MDDLQRQPADKDREQLESRIKRVHDEGRIGTADRDIRLGNVRSAQSMAELDLMIRELDQLEATLAPAPVAPTTQPGAEATPAAPWSTFKPKSRARLTSSSGRTAVLIGLVVGIVVIIAAVVAVLGLIATGSEEGSKASPAAPVQPGTDDTDTPGRPTPTRAPLIRATSRRPGRSTRSRQPAYAASWPRIGSGSARAGSWS